MQPETEEDDDLQLLSYVMWSSWACLRRAIELHNAQDPGTRQAAGRGVAVAA